MKPRKAVGAEKQGPEHLAPVESDVFSKLSQIVAHCAVVRYEDGSSRTPGQITIRCLGATWAVVAKDPDGDLLLTSIAATLDDALAQLDLLLGTEDAPWEVDQWAARRRAQKKK